MIETIEEAIEFLETKLNISVEDYSKVKWKVYDEDFTDFVDSDNDLIDYANEQQDNYLDCMYLASGVENDEVINEVLK